MPSPKSSTHSEKQVLQLKPYSRSIIDFLTAKKQKTGELSIGELRVKTLQEFWERMRGIDHVDAIRNSDIQNVISGKDTFHDLFRIDFSLNNRKAPLVASGFNGILSKTSEDERESRFPRQQICNYMGITEQQYKELDKNNYRRNVFLLLLSLFEDAQTRDATEGFKIPHILLIEELVTTLNAGCMCAFPYCEILHTTKDTVLKYNSQLPQNSDKPALNATAITCTDPNKITVSSSLRNANWLGVRAETLISYDIVITEDKLISYQNLHMTAVFQGTDRRLSAVTFQDYCRDPANSYDLQQAPPKIYPEQGVILASRLGGKTFTVESMLEKHPEEVRDHNEATKPVETRGHIVEEEINKQRAKGGTVLDKIRNLFVAIFRCIKRFFSSNNPCCTGATEENDKEYSLNSDRKSTDASGISVSQHTDRQNVTQVRSNTCSTAPEVTAPAQFPSSCTDVHSVTSSDRSQGR